MISDIPIPDVQSLRDDRNITVDKVGVKNIKYPVVVEDRRNKSQSTVADIDMYVELHHLHRGTHMSRFVEVLNKYHEENLVVQLPALLSDLKSRLKADASYIDIRFPYFVKKKAPVSKISSLQSYTCYFNASMKNEFKLWIGVDVPITTLCPCSKEISDFGAHNQRSEVRVKVCYNEFIWLEELIEIVEATASSQVYPLLKRIDEKHVTELAYKNPKFVEDIVRELTLHFERDKRIIAYFIESENYESIHSHNAYAYKSKP